MSRSWIGRPRVRVEDQRLLTGGGRYVSDIQLPRMLHMGVVRSPYAHARINAIDTSRLPDGVVAVLTGQDVAQRLKPLTTNRKGAPLLEHTTLPVDRALYVGQAVAALVAPDRYTAEDAVEAVAVDYTPLPAVIGHEQALSEKEVRVYPQWESNVYFQQKFSYGDVDGIFKEAPHTLRRTLRSHRHTGQPLEPRACVADYDGHTLTIWASTQWPHIQRTLLARMLDFPEVNLRVITPDIGGGFGVKLQSYPEYVLCALFALQLRRPVKWVEDRYEHFAATTHARGKILTAEAAYDDEGRLLAYRTKVVHDLGAATNFPPGMTAGINAVVTATGCYRVPAYAYEFIAVVTNTTPQGSYRGPGMALAALLMESVLDGIADHLGLDPLEVRRRNVISQDELPYRAPSGMFLESGSFRECLEAVARHGNYQQWRERQRLQREGKGDPLGDPRVKGKLIGIGLSCVVEGTAPSLQVGMGGWGAYDGVQLTLGPDGRMTAAVGVSSQGQGHATTIAQLVADEFGIDPQDVRVVAGDTSTTPYGLGAFGSRSAIVMAGAIATAAAQLREELAQLAAAYFEVDPRDVVYADGQFRVKGVPARSVTVAQLADLVYMKGLTLPSGEAPRMSATGRYSPPNIELTPDEHGRTNKHASYSNNAHMAVCAVDPETGAVEILQYVAGHDSGTVINPLIVDGQTTGAVAQGLGGMLLEELIYDDNGQLVTRSFADYLMPTAMEVPRMELVHLSTPSPSLPKGVKGMAEGGVVASTAAIAVAVRDALGLAGTELIRTPFRPDRNWELLKER